MELNFERITEHNLFTAIAVQKTIFPKEDATLNFLANINPELLFEISGFEDSADDLRQWLVYEGKNAVGITGIYFYSHYPDDAWLAWYGVLPKYRKRGIGTQILNWTQDFAKSENFKNMRLYVDNETNKCAVDVYEKNGFVGEKYTAEKLNYDCSIYSKSLTSENIMPWNNKFLNLVNQSKMDQTTEQEIKDILNKFLLKIFM